MSSYWFGLLWLCFLCFIDWIFYKNFFFDCDLIFIQNKVLLFNNKTLFFISVTIISMAVLVYSTFYMIEKYNSYFYYMMMGFVFSMLSLIMSDSFFFIILGWEGLGVTSFLLILFYQNWVSLNGANLTILTNRIGDSILLVSFIYLLWNMNMILKFSMLSLSLILIVCFTKSAQWPFSSWLPAAMAAPTPISALVHSSTLVTAGIWLLIRFLHISYFNSFGFFFFGLLTVMMAGMAAVMEKDVKKLVALSTLSQLGLMMISLFFGGKFISFFQLLTHAFTKAGLFLLVGIMISMNFSSQDSRIMSSFYLFNSLTSIIFLLSLSGLFFMSGFFSKEMILIFFSLKMETFWFIYFLLFISSMTFLYCFNIYKIFHFNTGKLENSLMIKLFSSFPVLLMVMLSLYFGFFFNKNMSTLYSNYSTMEGLFFILSFSLFFLLKGEYFFYLNSEISSHMSWNLTKVFFLLKVEKFMEFIQVLQLQKVVLQMSSNFLWLYYSLVFILLLFMYN